MKAVFRVDASNHMGSGHFVRCLTLANALRQRGADVRFICRAHVGNMIATLARSAIPVVVLPAPPTKKKHTEDYALWLGVTQETDAAETVAALNGERPDWLIVDHYGLDAGWEGALRPHVGHVLAIDDLANRPHDCDVLLDQNYSRDAATRYENWLPSHCQRLLGPRYALLRPEYAEFRKIRASREGKVQRVLVFFGGTDVANATGTALEALMAPEFRELHVDVVVGASNPHRGVIERQVSQRPFTALHEPRPHLADLMALADLALGAGGATTWERLCLGLPSLVVSIAENQVPACGSLGSSGYIEYLGPISGIGSEQIRLGLLAMMNNPPLLEGMVTKGKILVDGLGALRVAEKIDPTPAEQLQLRPAQREDVVLYFNWVNEPEVRSQSFDAAPIPWHVHQKWFYNRLADPNCRLWVLLAGMLPVGQIRFDVEGDEARIDYSLDVLVRGRHWAANMVAMGARLLQDSLPVMLTAEVKEGNFASRAVFMRLGFESPSPLSRGMQVFVLPSFQIAAVGSTNSPTKN